MSFINNLDQGLKLGETSSSGKPGSSNCCFSNSHLAVSIRRGKDQMEVSARTFAEIWRAALQIIHGKRDQYSIMIMEHLN